MKMIGLRLISVCFQLHLRHKSPIRTIKLIKLDGLIEIFDRPINASALMLENPKHLICSSDSFYIGKKLAPLSENEKLQLGKKYFLLPTHYFQSVLSFMTISSLTSKNDLLKRVAEVCPPFDVKKTDTGSLQIKVSDEFISNLMRVGNTREEIVKKNRVCNTPELERDYRNLVGYGSHPWRPKLDTIKERKRKKIDSFHIKRRMKSQSE